MSIPTHETTMPLVCVLDRDGGERPSYQGVVEGQGMQLLFFQTVAELRSQTPLDRISAYVLDVEADHGNAVHLQRELLDRDTSTPVILTTSDRNSDEVVQGLGLGAVALLQRPWGPDLLAEYLVFAHTQHIEQADLDRKHRHLEQILANLTPRQQRVLELAATGVPNKLIATQIEVSQRTVESERSKLLDAFGADSYSDAMISLGAYRVLEQVARVRRRDVMQRLGMHSASLIGQPFQGASAQHAQR